MADQNSGHGNGDSNDEPARTTAKLEMVHAAMMEELGISRKDNLSLADRGANILIPPLNVVKNARPTKSNEAVSAWRNMQFNDIDPAQEELDSIADGQLYRLRRGTSSAAPGRGRGGFANRGGHAFTPRGHSSSAYKNRPTPQSFYNSRRDNQAMIENAITRLREEPSQTVAPPKKRSRNGRDAQREHQPMRVPQRTNRSITPIQATKFNNDALAKPKVGLSGSRWEDPSPFQHVTQVPHAGHRASFLPGRPTPTSDAEPFKGHINNQQSSHESVKVLPKAGLSASQWAPFPTPTLSISSASVSHTAKSKTVRSESSQISLLDLALVAAVPSPIAATPISAAVLSSQLNVQGSVSYGGLDASRWAPSLVKPQVSVRTNSVKVQKDGGEKQDGTLRVMKDEIRSPLILTVEIQEDGRRVIDETISIDSMFLVNDEIISYKAKDKDGTSPSPLWEISFPLPYQARGVYKTLIGDPFRPISGGKIQAHVSDTSASARPPATAPYAQTATHLNADIDRQFSEYSLTNDTTDLISMASEDERPQDVNHRISTRNFNLLNSLEGGTQLLDINDEDEDDKAIEQNGVSQQDEDNGPPSALMDLSVLNVDYIVQGIFQSINAFYKPFFLSRLLSVVGKTKLGCNASTNEYMSSPLHITAAEDLVGKFFGNSEVFAQLGEQEEVAYIKDISWKILGKALMERDEAIEEASANDEDNTSCSVVDSESAYKYSVDKLQAMRSRAVEFREELLPKKEMGVPPRITNRAALSNKSTSSSSQKPNQGRPGQLAAASHPTSQIQAAAPPTEDWQSMFTNNVSYAQNAVHTPYVTPLEKIQSTTVTKPTESAGWHGFVKSSIGIESKQDGKPVSIVLDDTPKQSPPKTSPSKMVRVVEVYKARDLNPSTSTGGWANYAKNTSGLEPVVRPPTLVAPVNWRSFATTQWGEEPEKPIQRTPDPVQHTNPEPKNQNILCEEGEILSKQSCPEFPKADVQVPKAKEEQSQALPPHLRKSKPAIKSEAIAPIQDVPQRLETQNKTIVSEPPIFNAIMADLSSVSKKVETPEDNLPQNIKQSENGQPPRLTKHHPTNSDFTRLTTNFEELKLDNDDQKDTKSPVTFFETLKKAPGLSGSMWASSPAAKVSPSQDAHKPIKFQDRVRLDIPFPRPSRSYVSAMQYNSHQSSNSLDMQYSEPNTPHQSYLQNGYQLPLPHMSQIRSVPVAMQTILVPDPNTGNLIEITGMVKGTLSPLPSNHENVSYLQGHTDRATSFPPREDMYNRNFSNDSSGSDIPFSPSARPFKPSPRPGDPDVASSSRSALSPIRRGENAQDVQAALQQRLNQSLGERTRFTR